jgi:RNA polymerase sigma-70 factor (ECF subfamily)
MDQQEFGALVEQYRRELHVHCYRMLGSVHDADDMVQETLLRAWRRREILEEISSLRAWLYRIATNVCLDALKSRPRRSVPRTRSAASTLDEPIPQEIAEPIWLEPYADALLQTGGPGPEEHAVAREHISIAFMVALHRLPPRQRAVLLLRDVLGWPASEVAALLNTTVAAVKSALHRARALLADQRAASDADHVWPLDSVAQTQLDAYVRAWHAADIAALVRLLAEDATYSMPPIPAWYRGRETIRALMLRTVFSTPSQRRWRLLPTRANRQPAFGLYLRADTPACYSAYGIQLVTLHDGLIADVLTFRDPSLFPYFNLPMTISSIQSHGPVCLA